MKEIKKKNRKLRVKKGNKGGIKEIEKNLRANGDKHMEKT